MPSANDLDAVTIDAMGTLVELDDPIARLQTALERRGVHESAGDVAAAFAAEVEYYLPRAHEGRDDESLRRLGEACAGVFLRHLDATLQPAEFAPDFVGALHFRPLAGVTESLELLRAAGLSLACVSNWDLSLRGHLERAALARRLDVVVSSAEAGAAKPDPRPFRLALERLHAKANRTVHVGDGAADAEGASSAGLHFAPAPLGMLPERLGLGANA